MNNAIDWFTKKKTFYVSALLVLIYVISYFNRALYLPEFYRDFCCIDDRKLNLFLIAIPTFVLYFIFLKQKDSAFKMWKKFTLIYLPIYVVIYFLSPTQGDGLIWFQRETISFFGSITYSIISIILITYQSFQRE